MNISKRFTRIAIATTTLGLVALSSTPASAQETVEHEIIRPNRPLLVGGLSIVAVSYIPAVAVAATSEHAGDDHLYVPLAGPWMDLADRGGCTPNSCEEEAVYKGMLITAGVAHAVGVGLIVSSFLVPEEHTRRTAAAPKPNKPMVLPAQMGKAGAGLTVVGQF
jgi:hypothetical protein